MKEILSLISTYPDYPKEGVIFQDVLGILQDLSAFKMVIDNMSNCNSINESDAIIGIEARGFIFASAIALNLNKPLVLARKGNKLPGKVIKKRYNLEYGFDTLSIQKVAIKNFEKFSIVDDVIASGGTVGCVANLLESENKFITGISVLLELKKFHARENLKYNLKSQVEIR